MYDNFLQSGPTIKRRSFEHRHQTSTQHRNPKDGRKPGSEVTHKVASCCFWNNNTTYSFAKPKDSSSVIQFVTRGSVQVNEGVLEVQNGLSEDFSVSIMK